MPFLNMILSQLEYYLNRPSKADIVLYDDLTYENVVLPVVPATLPKVEYTMNNEVFNGATGDILLAGYMGLRTYSLDNILLPVNHKYKFMRPRGSDGEEVKEFITQRMELRQVLRIAVTFSDGSELLNMACLCNKAYFIKDKVGDYKASLEFTEYPYVNQTINSTTGDNNTLSG